MSVYLVSYDFIKEKSGTDPGKPLRDELTRLEGHRVQYSLWLVNVNNTAQELCDHLRSFMDQNDRILVSKVRAKEYHWYNALAGMNEWIKNNPPDPASR